MTGYTTTIGNRLTADGSYTYSYDNDGNMVGRTRTSDSQVTTFTYDFRNRLTEVLIKTSTGTTVQDDKFTYDVENRRIGKNTLSGGQSWTGYDGVNPYADFNSSGSLTYRYLYGNAIDFLLARVDTSGIPMWYLTDKLGSVREDVQTSGSVLDSITYDSYGNILTESSPSNGDRFKFTGREWDSEIGQYYYRARYYGPKIGRFESEDPLGLKAGDTNLYRYVFNRPSYFVDPTGMLSQGEVTLVKKTIDVIIVVGRTIATVGLVTVLAIVALPVAIGAASYYVTNTPGVADTIVGWFIPITDLAPWEELAKPLPRLPPLPPLPWIPLTPQEKCIEKCWAIFYFMETLLEFDREICIQKALNDHPEGPDRIHAVELCVADFERKLAEAVKERERCIEKC